MRPEVVFTTWWETIRDIVGPPREEAQEGIGRD
jgi:hypothetical protein